MLEMIICIIMTADGKHPQYLDEDSCKLFHTCPKDIQQKVHQHLVSRGVAKQDEVWDEDCFEGYLCVMRARARRVPLPYPLDPLGCK